MLRQGINEISLNPKYPVGYVYRDGIDTYVYAHAGKSSALLTGQLRPGYAVYSNLRMTETGNPVANVAVGDFVVQALAVADVIADQFKDGKMVVSSGAGYGTQYKIRGNGAAAAGNNYYIYLDSPILVALTAGVDTITMYRIPYHDVHSMRQELIDLAPAAPDQAHKVSWVGVPTRFVTADYYCWLKTWGPTFVVMEVLGAGADERMLGIDYDGSFQSIVSLVHAATQNQQIGGFLLPATDAGDSVPNGMGLIMLQISP